MSFSIKVGITFFEEISRKLTGTNMTLLMLGVLRSEMGCTFGWLDLK